MNNQINNARIGKALLTMGKKRAADNKHKLVPDSLFLYAELTALGTILGRVVYSDSIGRWESSQQNYLILAKKGVGKNSVIEASIKRIKELMSLNGMPRRPQMILETSTPEALAKSLGYYRTFDKESEMKKIMSDKDNSSLHQSQVDAMVDSAEDQWETDAQQYLEQQRLTTVWYSCEASTVLSSLIGGARSDAEIGAKIGWALNAFDPKGALDSLRVGTGNRYVREVCLSSLWATQPQTFYSSYNIEVLRYTGFFERFVPVVGSSDAKSLSYDADYLNDLDHKISKLHQSEAKVRVGFSKLPKNLDKLIEWQKNLPAIKQAMRFDDATVVDSLSKWFAHARRIAQLRAFFELVTLEQIANASGFNPIIDVDGSDFIADALEWVAEHYFAHMQANENAERDETFDKFMALLRRYAIRFDSDDKEEREQAQKFVAIDKEKGNAYFRVREVADRFKVKGMNRTAATRMFRDWADSSDIVLTSTNPDKDKWNRKAEFIVVRMNQLGMEINNE